MQKTIRTIIAGLAAMQCLTTAAQLGDPREKLSITTEVDGATNTDYHWETTEGHLLENGRLRQGVNARLKANVRLMSNQRFLLAFNPFYNFSTRSLKANDDGPRLDMPIPDAHHHYGGGLMATYNTKWLGKPFTLTGTITGNFSQYGYENFSAMAGALFTITRNRSTYLALGGLLLVGTSISWPLFPLIVYNHRLDNHWSISCLETNNYLYYQASPKLRCALGMEIVTDKIFIRPKREDLPEKMEISELSERFGLFADLMATRQLSLNLGLGVTVPFYNRLRESGYNKTYMRLYDHVKPFVKLQLKYSISQSK